MSEGEKEKMSKCLLRAGIRALLNELLIRYGDQIENADDIASLKDPEEGLKLALSQIAGEKAFSLLKDFAPICDADYETLKEVFSKKYPPELIDKLVELGMLEKRGDRIRLPLKTVKNELKGDMEIVAEYWKKMMEKEGGAKEVCEYLNSAIEAGMLEEAVDLYLKQDSSSAKLMEIGEKLFERLDNEAAKKKFGEKWVNVIRKLAEMCFDVGRKDEAEKYYSITIQEYIELAKKDENKIKDLAKLLYNVANLYHFTRKYDEAEKNYEWAADLMREMKMEEELAIVLDSLGLLCMNLNKNDKAKAALEEAVKIRKKLSEKDVKIVPEYAKTVNNLGVLYRRMKMFDEVEKMYMDVLESLRDLAVTSPEVIPELATVLNNIASLYIDEGELDKAEKYIAELMMYENQMPPDIKARYYMNLAKVLERKDEQSAGEYYFKAACLAFNLFKNYGYNAPNFVMLFDKAEKLAKGEISGDAAIMKNAIMRFYYKVDTVPPSNVKYSKRGELILKAAKGESMEFIVQNEEDATAHIIAMDILPKARAKMKKYK